MRYPQQFGRSWKVLYRNPPELCLLCAPDTSATLVLLSAPEPSEPHQPSGTLQKIVCTRLLETSSAICTGTLRNLVCHLHRNPSRTSSAICPGTLRNPPEPHQPSAPEPSRTSSAICTRRLRNLPEPSRTFSGTGCCSCTGSHQSYSGLKTPS